MSTSTADHISDDDGQGFGSHFPTILLASDDARVAESYRRRLSDEGFDVDLAPGYHALEIVWEQHRHRVILLDVSSSQAVEAAVDAAMTIKRLNSGQFVGYLADPILRTSGLAGDAIFPRNLHQLPAALRRHFSGQAGTQGSFSKRSEPGPKC